MCLQAGDAASESELARLSYPHLMAMAASRLSGRETAHEIVQEALLADVFFHIYEFDFERGIVSYWGKATAAQKQELWPILRDHYAAYQEARAASRQMPQRGIPIIERCLALADRYRKASFAKGELQAMLWASSLSDSYWWNIWQFAKSLGDEVGEAWGAYYYGGLPG